MFHASGQLLLLMLMVLLVRLLSLCSLLLSSHLIDIHDALLLLEIGSALTICKLIKLGREHVLRLRHLMLHVRLHGSRWELLVVWL